MNVEHGTRMLQPCDGHETAVSTARSHWSRQQTRKIVKSRKQQRDLDKAGVQNKVATVNCMTW